MDPKESNLYEYLRSRNYIAVITWTKRWKLRQERDERDDPEFQVLEKERTLGSNGMRSWDRVICPLGVRPLFSGPERSFQDRAMNR